MPAIQVAPAVRDQDGRCLRRTAARRARPRSSDATAVIDPARGTVTVTIYASEADAQGDRDAGCGGASRSGPASRLCAGSTVRRSGPRWAPAAVASGSGQRSRPRRTPGRPGDGGPRESIVRGGGAFRGGRPFGRGRPAWYPAALGAASGVAARIRMAPASAALPTPPAGSWIGRALSQRSSIGPGTHSSRPSTRRPTASRSCCGCVHRHFGPLS